MYPQCPAQGLAYNKLAYNKRCSVTVQRMSFPSACSALPHLLYQQTPIHPSRPSFRVFCWELVPPLPLCCHRALHIPLLCHLLHWVEALGFFLSPLSCAGGGAGHGTLHAVGTLGSFCVFNLTQLFGSLLRIICVVFHLPCAVWFPQPFWYLLEGRLSVTAPALYLLLPEPDTGLCSPREVLF